MPTTATIPHRHRFLNVLLAASCAGLAAAAVEPVTKPEVAGQLTLATERVVIFKDGYALFVKTATGTADGEGRVYTDQVAEGAVLGCFWATSDQQKAVGISADWVESTEVKTTTTACISTVELLRANRGHKVALVLSGDKAPTVNGTIAAVLDLPAEPLPPTPRPSGVREEEVSALERFNARVELPVLDPHELVPRGGQLVAIDTDQGHLVLPVAQVMTIAGPELVTTMERRTERTVWRKRLGFDLGKEAANHPSTLRILYFAEGLRWIPTYRIGGALEDKAEIALQGEVINEGEDIADAAVDLVVGVPNFRFKTTVSPLSLEGTLRHALSAVAPNLGNQSYNSGTFDNRLRAGGGRAGDGALDLAPELSASGQQDLFVYGAKRLALKKGARITIPLWQSSAALRHLYTLDIPVVRDAQSGGTFQRGRDDARESRDPADRSPQHLAENQVWHQFELSNASAVPWTTGAALIIRDTLPMGQDLLTYTPVGSATLLPVTVAIDMCGSYSEEELSRQPNALHWNGSDYALIRKKATVTVRNQRKQASLTRIGVALGGKAEKISDDGRIQLNDHRSEDWNQRGGHEVNNHSDLSWEFTLEAGATKTLTCEFAFYQQ